jgi:hypothetical protein
MPLEVLSSSSIDRAGCDDGNMMPKIFEEGPAVLRNFTRIMKALFQVSKPEVEMPKPKPSFGKKMLKRG